ARRRRRSSRAAPVSVAGGGPHARARSGGVRRVTPVGAHRSARPRDRHPGAERGEHGPRRGGTMKTRWLALAFALATACGPAVPPADEVTERWTAGDDAPLDPDASRDTADRE